MKKLAAKTLAGVMAAAMIFTGSVIRTPSAASAKTKVTVKKVSVKAPSGKTAYVAKGKKISLTTTVKVTPDKAANKKVTYKSAKTSIATVNAKGVVKAKKAGTTKITVSSKVNKKKKATIKVVVKKTAVKKIKLDKTSLSMGAGEKKTLKATVTAAKTASKKVQWKSSKTSVATVSSKGVVTAKKKGSAQITVTAADGSGKKATCNVTVKEASNAAKSGESVINAGLVKASVINARTISFTLDSKANLDKSKVTIKRKSHKESSYLNTAEIENLSSSDNTTYQAILHHESELELNDYVQINIPSLSGTKAIETQYKENVTAYTDDEVSTWNVDTYGSQKFTFYESEGYSTYSITSLPAGLTSQTKGNSILVKGTPTKAGQTRATLTAKDERGNTLTKTIYFVVGSDTQIVGAAAPYYTMAAETKNAYNVNADFFFAGGSGYYDYSIIDKANLDISLDYDEGIYENRIVGTTTKAGTYNVKIQATDKRIPNLSATITMTFHVAQAVTISGKVLDATKNGMPWDEIVFTNKDSGNRYVSGDLYAKSPADYVKSSDYDTTTAYNEALKAAKDKAMNGEYQIRLVEGNYDVKVYYNSDSDTAGTVLSLYNQSYKADNAGVNFTLPMYRVTLSGEKANADGENIRPESYTWHIKNGDNCSVYRYKSAELSDFTAFTFVKAGTYTIESEDVKINTEVKTVPEVSDLDWFTGYNRTTTTTYDRCRYTATVKVSNQSVNAPLKETIVKKGVIAAFSTMSQVGVKDTTYVAELNTHYELNQTGDYYGYKFTPDESGSYDISVSYVYLYDANGTQLSWSEESGYVLTAGTTYYIASGYRPSIDGFRIKKMSV